MIHVLWVLFVVVAAALVVALTDEGVLMVLG